MSNSILLAKDGLAIFTREWLPIGSPQGLIVLVHGMGEHSGRYNELAERFTKNGYIVMALDLRGHGESEGQRGHISSYDDFIKDIHELILKAQNSFPKMPIFLYGHSLGGNLVLNYALKSSTELSGVIATSPWLRLAFEPSKIKVLLANLMNIVWPNFTQKNELNISQLTRSKNIVNNYLNDPLVHNKISARLFKSVYEAGHWALNNASKFSYPLLIMHGKNDAITSCEASEEFSKLVPNNLSTFKLWNDFYHELHNEPDSESVLHYIFKWLDTINKN